MYKKNFIHLMNIKYGDNSNNNKNLIFLMLKGQDFGVIIKLNNYFQNINKIQ